MNANATWKICSFRKKKSFRFKDKNEADDDPTNISYFLPIYMIAGVFGLPGNTAVLFRTSYVLHYKRNVLSSVQHIHNILLLNLAIADLLMGLYLCIFALLKILGKTGTFPEIQAMLRFTSLCSFLGILNFISSQVSVTMLVIMTTFSVQSIRKPYKHVHSSTATLCAALCWFVWFLVALIPVINTDELQKIFVKKVRFEIISPSNVTQQRHVIVSYKRLMRIVSNPLRTASADCVLPASPSWRVLVTLAKRSQLYGNETLLGYYNKQIWCSVSYFVNINQRSSFYTLSIVACNFAAFAYIAASYCFIAYRTSKTSCCAVVMQCLKQKLTICSVHCLVPQNNEAIAQSAKSKEDEKMHKLITLIIATDFICWVPVCFLSFLYAACTAPNSAVKCLKRKHRLLSLIAIVCVPLNSFINPLLYSASLRNCFIDVCRRIIGNHFNRKSESIQQNCVEEAAS